jgi:hypothetical protein
MASIDQNAAYWEVTEERTLPAPHARTRVVKMSRAYWGCFDFLVQEIGISPEKLVDLAEQEAEFQGVSFDVLFPDAMAFMDQEFSRKTGRA